jgi:hypothetical protein
MFEVRCDNRLRVHAAKHNSLFVAAVLGEQPHPFRLARPSVFNLELYVVTLWISTHGNNRTPTPPSVKWRMLASRSCQVPWLSLKRFLLIFADRIFDSSVDPQNLISLVHSLN